MNAVTVDSNDLIAANEDAPARGNRWLRWGGPLMSVAVVAMVIHALGGQEWAQIWAKAPRGPGFWLGLALFLAIQPVADYLIFRDLWKLPIAGLVALFRKSASNELLVGYSGELQFYLWARERAPMAGSPFGAVRDVAVISALVGNFVTLLLLIGAAVEMLGPVDLGPIGWPMIWSGVIVLVSSSAILLFRKRLFTISGAQFWRVTWIHLVRSVAMIVAVAALWAMIDPAVGLGWWLVFSAVRQFVTRLPFIPNKDLVFAGLATGIAHAGTGAGTTVALVAAAIFVGQLVIGAVLGAADVASAIAARKEA